MFANPRLIPRSFSGPLIDLEIQLGTERLPRVYKHPPPPFISSLLQVEIVTLRQSNAEHNIREIPNVVFAPWMTTLHMSNVVFPLDDNIR